MLESWKKTRLADNKVSILGYFVAEVMLHYCCLARRLCGLLVFYSLTFSMNDM